MNKKVPQDDIASRHATFVEMGHAVFFKKILWFINCMKKQNCTPDDLSRHTDWIRDEQLHILIEPTYFGLIQSRNRQ